jgi:hypothetical protein
MLGIAALLGPWAAHLDCESSSFHDFAKALPQPARLPHRKARSRDGAVASRSNAGDETGTPLDRDESMLFRK